MHFRQIYIVVNIFPCMKSQRWNSNPLTDLDIQPQFIFLELHLVGEFDIPFLVGLLLCRLELPIYIMDVLNFGLDNSL